MKSLISMKYNRRILPVYKGLTSDPLFYSAVIFLFLNQVKHFSASKILYAEAFYNLFVLLFQIPASLYIERIGSRKALLIGSILTTFQITLMIFANNFIILILSNCILAFSNAIGNVAFCDLLYDSTKECVGKSSCEALDAKGASISYILGATTSILAGYLFVINPYIPMILAILVSLYVILLCYRIDELHIKTKPDTTLKESISNSAQGFKFIAESKRLKSFFLFITVFSGILMMISTYEKNLLTDLSVKPQYFGLIFAFLIIIQSLTVKTHDILSKKLKNKTLTFLSLPIFISFIIMGIITTLDCSTTTTFIVVAIAFLTQHSLRAPYFILEKKYTTHFTTADIRVKILSAGEFIASLGKIFMSAIGGLLLEYFSTSQAYIIFGWIGFILMILILRYMKTRFGLRADQYNKKDIEYEKN